MKLAALTLAIAIGSSAFAQESGRPIRIPVRHADPYMIKALLEGQTILQPELSTSLQFAGVPAQAPGAVNAFFKNGRLVVNPTDNSLWFFPNRA
ncbi:MAG TPA: hypothetical protein PKA27_09775 [Fimbriimonadaceae bacterium]|nr:hypothetical protein [Fimbriimonadaceae bacterium]